MSALYMTFYIPETGRMVGHGVCPMSMREGQRHHVEGTYAFSEKYVDISTQVNLYDKAVLDRPEMQTTLVGLDLTDIPLDSIEPMKLEIKSSGKSDVYDVAGESAVELSFPFPGKYSVRLFGFPYIDKTWEVNV